MRLDFLNSVHAALDENGVLRIATDHLDYFREVGRVARTHFGFTTADVADVDLPLTKFQEKFRAEGAPIYWLELRKVSPVR